MSDIDHAAELRRYSRKLGAHSGDTASVMCAAADEIERLKHERTCLTEAIRDMTVKAGIFRSDADLTWPHLLIGCEDMLYEIERLRTDANMLQWLIDRAAMSYPSGEGSNCKDAYLVITGYGREHGDEIVRSAIMDEIKGSAA